MASNPISPDYASDNESTGSYESIDSYESNTSCRVSKLKCEECNRKFTTRFNLSRHMKSFHEESGEESDEEESDMSVDENDSDSESNDSKENYPTSLFRQLICQTVNEHEDELSALVEDMTSKNLSEKEVVKRALLSSKDALKTLQQNMIDIIEHRRHPLNKAIMCKAKELQDDGFSLSEAVT